MKFAVSRIWRDSINHSSDWYFCLVDPSKRRAGKKAPAIVYSDIPSSIAPVQQSAHLPVPNPPPLEREQTSEDKSNILKNKEGTSNCVDYITGDKLEQKKLYFSKQQDINDLIKDLGLIKSNAELLTYRLKQSNMLDSLARVTE